MALRIRVFSTTTGRLPPGGPPRSRPRHRSSGQGNLDNAHTVFQQIGQHLRKPSGTDRRPVGDGVLVEQAVGEEGHFLTSSVLKHRHTSSSSASTRKVTGRNPSLQESMAERLFFIHPS